MGHESYIYMYVCRIGTYNLHVYHNWISMGPYLWLILQKSFRFFYFFLPNNLFCTATKPLSWSSSVGVSLSLPFATYFKMFIHEKKNKKQKTVLLNIMYKIEYINTIHTTHAGALTMQKDNVHKMLMLCSVMLSIFLLFLMCVSYHCMM